MEAKKEKNIALDVFSFLEFLGIMGFILVLIYYGLQNAKIVTLPEFTTNPLSVVITLIILTLVFILGFVVSNPKQDRLDAANMKEWTKERKNDLIAWYEDHPLVA